MRDFPISFLVTPAKAGVHCAVAAMKLAEQWIPAFAGMTKEDGSVGPNT